MNTPMGSRSAKMTANNTDTRAGMTTKISATARNQRKCRLVSAASARIARNNSTGSDFA